MKPIIKKFESVDRSTVNYKTLLWWDFNVNAINIGAWKPWYLFCLTKNPIKLIKKWYDRVIKKRDVRDYDVTDYEALVMMNDVTKFIEKDATPVFEWLDSIYISHQDEDELDKILEAIKKVVPNFIICREKKNKVFEIIEYNNSELVKSETKPGFPLTAALIKSSTIMKKLKK